MIKFGEYLIFAFLATVAVLSFWAARQHDPDYRPEMKEELNVTYYNTVNTNLYNVAHKATMQVERKGAKEIGIRQSDNDAASLRIVVGTDGGRFEKEATLFSNVHAFLIAKEPAITFIRDDTTECLILWYEDNWNLAVVNIRGEKMEMAWKETGDLNLRQELHDFSKRSLTAYHEL